MKARRAALAACVLWSAYEVKPNVAEADWGRTPVDLVGSVSSAERLQIQYVAAHLANDSYDGRGTFRRWGQGELGLKEVGYVELGDYTEVLFSEDADGDTFWVTVPGTDGWGDVGSDINIRQNAPGWDPEIRLHEGFVESANAAYANVRDRVRDAKARGKKVVLSGHSLGGAVVTILAYRLTLDELKPKRVVTFGSPRVGDSVFREKYNERLGTITDIYVNDEDPAPCWPTRDWRYSHVGLWRFIDQEAFAVVGEGSPAYCGWTDDDQHSMNLYQKAAIAKAYVGRDYLTQYFRGPFGVRSCSADPGGPTTCTGDYEPPTILDNWDTDSWPVGFTHLETFSTGSGNFMLVYNQSTGETRVHRITPSGLLGERVYEGNIGPSAMNVMVYSELDPHLDGLATDATETYLVALQQRKEIDSQTNSTKYSTAYRSYPVSDRGAIGERIASGVLPNTEGLSVKPAAAMWGDGTGYWGRLFYTKSISSWYGVAYWFRRGKLDRMHETIPIPASVTSTEFFQVADQVFLFMLAEDTGLVEIRKAYEPATLVKTYDWTRGWTSARFLETEEGDTLLHLLKRGDGSVHVHEMNSNGTVGDMLIDTKEKPGWAHVGTTGNKLLLMQE